MIRSFGGQMREIEFRGKRVDNNEWAYGYLYVDEDTDEAYIVNRIYHVDMGEYNVTEFEIISKSVGEYTGLKDKNGKKIFEGDIFKFDNYEANKGISVVEWGNNKAGFRLKTLAFLNYNKKITKYKYYSIPKDCEVLGNKFDNPELLEGIKC